MWSDMDMNSVRTVEAVASLASDRMRPVVCAKWSMTVCCSCSETNWTEIHLHSDSSLWPAVMARWMAETGGSSKDDDGDSMADSCQLEDNQSVDNFLVAQICCSPNFALADSCSWLAV